MAELNNRGSEPEEKIDLIGTDRVERVYSSPSEEEYRRRELAGRRRARAERERKRRQQIRRRKIAVVLLAAFAVGMAAFALVRGKLGQTDPSGPDVSGQIGATADSEVNSDQEVIEQSSPKEDPEGGETAAEITSAEETSTEEVAAESISSEQETSGQETSEQEASAAEQIVFADAGNVPDLGEEVTSEYGILVDIDAMKIVAGRNYYDMMYPASMTKVLTVLVAAENVDWSKLDTDTFEMTQEILDITYGAGASQVGWAVGDTPTVRDLFMGTILPSGGDAAMGLATYTAGDVDTFMEMMNDKLAKLGLSDTAHFVNMTGLYDDNHYCTAYDMAVIMRAAIGNDLARKALSEHHYVTTPVQSNEDGYDISNWFLRRIEDRDTHGEVIAAKTGFVDESGNCAVSYQISNSGSRYICVTAGALSSWGAIADHVAIYTAYTD